MSVQYHLLRFAVFGWALIGACEIVLAKSPDEPSRLDAIHGIFNQGC